MTSPNVDLCGSNNFDRKCSKKNFYVIFVISGEIASFWRVFIKFHWHGQKLTGKVLQKGHGQNLIGRPRNSISKGSLIFSSLFGHRRLTFSAYVKNFYVRMTRRQCECWQKPIVNFSPFWLMYYDALLQELPIIV